MYTYLIRCLDNSLYCGYTTDIDRRISEHKNGVGSKYVSAKGFLKVEIVFKLKDKSSAMKLECFIKRLSKKKKEELIEGSINHLKGCNVKYNIYNNKSNVKR